MNGGGKGRVEIEQMGGANFWVWSFMGLEWGFRSKNFYKL
jgi:hypothetical protein